MKVFAMDIGAGTVDTLLYDSKLDIENCVKMVLPSPSKVYAKMVSKATSLGEDLFIEGDTIGGGSLTTSLKQHIGHGLHATMTEKAALSIRNNLEEVKQIGIKVSETARDEFDGITITLDEIRLSMYETFLTNFGESLSNVKFVAIAVKDHGASPEGESDRRFRMKWMKEILKKDARLEAMAFNEKDIPPFLFRMRSGVEASKRHLPNTEVVVMDTSFAAIIGSYKDPVLEKANLLVSVNVGNGHTMASVTRDNILIGLFEHHTSALTRSRLEKMLIDFTNGSLTDKEIFEKGGHGLFYLEEAPGFNNIEAIAVTGPKRQLLKDSNLKLHFAAPGGSMMMTGPIGLVEAISRK